MGVLVISNQAKTVIIPKDKVKILISIGGITVSAFGSGDEESFFCKRMSFKEVEALSDTLAMMMANDEQFPVVRIKIAPGDGSGIRVFADTED